MFCAQFYNFQIGIKATQTDHCLLHTLSGFKPSYRQAIAILPELILIHRHIKYFISDDLVAICKEYHSKLYKLEGDKWDLERGIKIRVLEVKFKRQLLSALSLFFNFEKSGEMIKPPCSFQVNIYILFCVLDQLKQICKEYFDRMYTCESQKYDMEFEVRKRGFEVFKMFDLKTFYNQATFQQIDALQFKNGTLIEVLEVCFH